MRRMNRSSSVAGGVVTSSRAGAHALLVVSLLAVGCNGDGTGGGGDGGAETGGAFCDTDADPGGDWDPDVVDWSDPGEPGDPLLLGECPDGEGAPTYITPHHAHLSPVHAIHMPTPPGGELLMFHGQSEERVWPIATDASAMTWHPIPFCVPVTLPERCVFSGEEGEPGNCAITGGGEGPACTTNAECEPYTANRYPNIFCSGHGLLGTGDVFIAGGNITGNGGDGGLYHGFLFNPRDASDSAFPYGWARVGGAMAEEMEVDRWYPTVTTLADGRLLISGGASLVPNGQNSFEVYDPAAPAGSQIDRLPAALDFDMQTNGTNMPLYPFMFVLPNGDVFYAGGEGGLSGAYDGRVLVPDYQNPGAYGGWQWAQYSVESTTAGGSAVMYEPGKVMKSGGTVGNPGVVANNITEYVDLSNYPSNDYQDAPVAFTRQASTPGGMHRPRHFHTATLLPDGRVLVTGGNMRGNDDVGDDIDNPCVLDGQRIIDIPCADGCPSECRDDGFCSLYGRAECDDASDCPPGATCESERCRKACTSDADCPDIEGEPTGVCWNEASCDASEDTEVCDETPIARCYPGDNECFSTRTAEIWDPDCKTWTELDAQVNERMYHSVALLLPDGRVISAGGGHERSQLEDQDNAEYFEPIYGDGVGARPLVAVADDDISNTEDYTVHMPYGPGQVAVQLLNDEARNVHGVTLVRLGSVTHQFDQGQLYLSLDYDHSGTDPTMMVTGPASLAGDATSSAVAPPGYYMMFVWGDNTPSVGQYVHLGDPGFAEIWTCPATTVLGAVETSCTDEPVAGVCSTSDQEQNLVALPSAEGAAGPVEGWNVLAPQGLVNNSAAPSANELAAVLDRCEAACEAQWAGNPAISANCADAGAFGSPQPYVEGSDASLDLVLPTQQNGSGVFTGQSLTCELGDDCCEAFDEDVCGVAPANTRPSDEGLGTGEEYRVALRSTGTLASKVEVVTTTGTYKSVLTGSIGYSMCRDGSTTAPCPFYLGSFDALASSKINARMRCADGTIATQTISNLVTKLAQPAFGIAAQGSTTTSKGFPPGALILESAFDIGTAHYTTRRPNTANAVMSANGPAFSATNLSVTLKVPCNTSTAQITVRYTVRDPGNGTALAKPPAVAINVPSAVSCSSPTTLAATVTDPNGDLDTVRWYVDGVLLAPGTSTLLFTSGHELRVVARDLRGGTTTAKKVVQCL
jgi:Domain of unknown function (DUF1929)